MSKNQESVESLWRRHLKKCEDFAYTLNDEGNQVIMYRWGSPHWEVLSIDGPNGLKPYIEKWMTNFCPSMYNNKNLNACLAITQSALVNLRSPLKKPDKICIALDTQVVEFWPGLFDEGPSIKVFEIHSSGRLMENAAIMRTGVGANTRDYLYPVRIKGVTLPRERYHPWNTYTPQPLQPGSIFHDFVHSSLHEEDIPAFQEFYGDLLCDRVRKAVPVLHGPPDSGKSRWLGLFGMVVGSNNVASADLGKMGQYSLQGWVGKPVVMIDELPKTIGDESVLKKCIGGAIVNVERKYLGPLDIEPRWKFLIAANHLPTFTEKTTAIHTRLRIFPVKGVPDVKIEEIDRKIFQTERLIVLDWMLEGLLAIETRGRALSPDELSENSKRVQGVSFRETNPAIAWAEDMEVVVDHSVWTPKDELHGLFREWAEQHGHRGFAGVSSVVFFRDMFFQAMKFVGQTADFEASGSKITIGGIRRMCYPVRVRNAKGVMQAGNNGQQDASVVVMSDRAKQGQHEMTKEQQEQAKAYDPFK